MPFWIVIVAFTAIAVASVLWPLARRRVAMGHLEASKGFYETQIAGIGRDLERGVISPAEAAAARNEAARRLIASGGVEAPPSDSERKASGNRRKAAMLSILLIPLIAIMLYSQIGRPTLPDRPLQARLNTPSGQQDIHLAIARIEAHLKRNPDDAKGWEVVAPVYMNLRRPADAARAWGHVVRIAGPTPRRLTALGEALTFASEGRVTPQALAAFRSAHELDDELAEPRFYIGLAAEQSGDKKAAREIWSKLLAEAPPGANWIGPVRERIAALAPAEGDQSSVPQPNPEAAKAIAGLPPEQRMQAIRGMVDNLAARLKDNGNDAEGWLRLIRAYTVLKEADKARAALADARKALAADETALKRIDALAKELGSGG